MDDHKTRPSLLLRLRTDGSAPTAWNEFASEYRPLIYAWCIQAHLGPSDADDVSQEVLLRLVQRMHSFHYDPRLSFRGYLRTITKHAISDTLAAQRTLQLSEAATVHLASYSAPDVLERMIYDEHIRQRYMAAAATVQCSVAPQTWAIFEAIANQGQAPSRVAQRLGITLESVYKAKSNVAKRLRAALGEMPVEYE